MLYDECMNRAGVIAYYKSRTSSIGFVVFDDGTSVMLPKYLSVSNHPKNGNISLRIYQEIGGLKKTVQYSFRSSESFKSLYKKCIKSLKEHGNLELNRPLRKAEDIAIAVPAKLTKVYKTPHELFKVLRKHKWDEPIFTEEIEKSMDQFLEDYDKGLYGDQFVKEDGTFGDIVHTEVA